MNADWWKRLYTLLGTYEDATFECGEHDSNSDESYATVHRRAAKARRALINHIRNQVPR